MTWTSRSEFPRASGCICARSCRIVGSSRTWSASGARTCCYASATSWSLSCYVNATSSAASLYCISSLAAVGPDDLTTFYALCRSRSQKASRAWIYWDPPVRLAGTCCPGSRTCPTKTAPAAVAARSAVAVRRSSEICFGAAAWDT